MNKKLISSFLVTGIIGGYLFINGLPLTNNVQGGHVHAELGEGMGYKLNEVNELLNNKGYTTNNVETIISKDDENNGDLKVLVTVNLEKPIPITSEEAKELFNLIKPLFQEKALPLDLRLSFPDMEGSQFQYFVHLNDISGELIVDNQLEKQIGVEEVQRLKALRTNNK
jgi:hypothetical protein